MIKKYSLVLITFLCSVFYSFGQEIASFSSVNDIACSGIITSDVNLTAIGICRGSGINYKNGTNYNSIDWTTNPTIDTNDYLEWSITPNIGYIINLSTLDIGYNRNPQGPTMTEIQVDFGTGFIPVFNDATVNAGGENNTGIDLSAYTNISSTITFRLYAYNASNTNGVFTVEEHTLTNKGIIINGTITPNPCSTTISWNGSSWDNGTPNINTFVIINGNYDTAISGSFEACNLVINADNELNVRNSTYVKVQNNVVVDGAIVVQTKGAFVQVDDLGTFIVNSGGSSSVIKVTSNLEDWLEYTYWSSPVNNQTVENAFPDTPTNRRFWFNAQNFLDETKEINNNNTAINGQDDIDDNGDDWQIATGTMSKGLGYAATSSLLGPSFPRQDQATFIGEFHTGDVTVPVYKNDLESQDNNWNLIGNPYPSAISADDFLTENVSAIDENVPFGGAIVGAIFLWSQNTPKSRYNNGNQKFNFSQSDYAIINLTTEIAGGDEVIPNRFIPSGQGFFIAYDHAAAGTEISPGSNIKESTIKFTNSMRMADATSNSQFFRGPGNLDNKLWINLTSDNGVFSQIAVAYVDGATHRYDGSAYDTKRISSIPRAATIYTSINGEKDTGFAIQTKSPANLTINEVIHLGFKTDISIPTLYKFSIPKLEGSFLETNNIYVKDNLLNKIHNLLDSDYTFTSETGEFNKRFDIVFKAKSNSFEKIAKNQKTLNSLKIIEHLDGNVEFTLHSAFDLKKIIILDFQGKKIYNLNANGRSKVFNLSNLKQAVYIAQVELSDGSVITEKLIKRK
ncbi:MAG: T9SS type A sorting domain-containing protein [Bacteroidetes bacterium]|nr:T9SS type A sorting domain-containing protein [Bacteroidota bacterium]